MATNADGVIQGELTLPDGTKLSVTGQAYAPQPAGNEAPWPLPGSVEPTATVGDTEYRLRGWFIPEYDAVAGTVLAVRNDLAGAPDGTLGSWILVKAG